MEADPIHPSQVGGMSGLHETLSEPQRLHPTFSPGLREGLNGGLGRVASWPAACSQAHPAFRLASSPPPRLSATIFSRYGRSPSQAARKRRRPPPERVPLPRPLGCRTLETVKASCVKSFPILRLFGSSMPRAPSSLKHL